MKKLFILAAIGLLLCSLPHFAQAGKCSDHPHAGTSKYPYGSYEQHSSSQHRREADEYCKTCGSYVGTTYVFEKHDFDSSGYCWKCGYQKQSKEELNVDAITASQDIIGRELRLQYGGKMYSRPNGTGMYSVRENEQYYILDYEEVNGTIWLQVSSTSSRNPLGWIKAEIASINSGGIRDETQELDLSGIVGRRFRIVVSSGRGRTGPGQEFAHVETVHYGDVYTIKDVAYATNGMAWYMLRVSGTDCWVSSGLGTIE